MLKWLYIIGGGAFILCISFLIIPSKEELALLHVNDKEYTTAETLYEQEVEKEKDDPDQRTVFPLVKIYLQKGETEKAEAVLKELVKDEPQNIDALKLLAKVYQDTQNTYDYIKTLEKLVKLEPNKKHSREIANYYNFVKDDEDRIRVLQDLVDRDSASKKQRIKLGKLYLGENQIDKGIEMLESALPAIEEYKKYNDLYFLLSLLIENDNALKAQHIAEDYISPKHVKSSVEILRYLFHQGAQEMAYKLTLQLAKKVPFDPLVIDWEIDYLLAMKQPGEALKLLLKLADQKQLPLKMEENLLNLAMMDTKAETLSKALTAVTIRTLPHKTLMTLAEHCIYNRLSNQARYVRLKLGDAYLSKTPLLGLLLKAGDKSIHQGADSEKNLHLKDFDQKDLSQQDRLKLAQLFHTSQADTLAKELLAKDFSFKGVDQKNIIGISETLIALGMAQKALLMMMKLYKNPQKAPPNTQIAWAYLATASGMEDKVSRWYHKQKNLTSKTKERLYDFAANGKLFKLAETLATDLYAANRTEKNLTRLVNAFLNNNSYAKAEPYLKGLAQDKGGAWEYDYLHVLKKLDKTGKIKAYWRAKAQNDDMDVKKKREIGYTLANAGDKAGAIKIFKELAEGKGPKNPDTEQLLSLFGNKNLSREGLRWVEAQTRTAPLRHKRTWLKRLLYAEHPKRVVKLVRDLKIDGKKGITDVYISALEMTRDKKGLRILLSKEIDKKTDETALAKLANLASFSGSRFLEEKALKKLAKINPNHPSVLKYKVAQALASKRYGKAMALLNKLFAKGHDDVGSLYNYAEIIRKRQGLEKSKIYYRKTLKRINYSQEKSTAINVIEAKSLYFIGKKPESIRKNREILATNKNNKSLKADIAHFYMDVGELKEAEAVLNG